MRLDKYLSNMGIGTRKEVKKYIEDGNVFVNDKVVIKAKQEIDEFRDKIELKNRQVISADYVYIMLNKPKGYISASKSHRKKTIIDLLDESLQNKGLSPAGRLDIDTEGLIILTNDGKFLQNIIVPDKNILKKYYARVDKELENDDIIKFENGIYLKENNYLCLSAKLEIISPFECFVYIREGKYHQVKRMLSSCGKNVTYLKRISIGSLVLDENLKLGSYRMLTSDEVNKLKRNDLMLEI